MKMLIVSAMLLFLVSCASTKDKFNDVKIDVAKEGKEFVTKELKSQYSKNELVVVDGFSCDSEAEVIGLKVEAKLLEFLKAEQKLAAMQDKSLTSEVLPAACHFVNDKVVPELLGKISTEYVCLRKLGAVKVMQLGKGLCDEIK